MKLGAIPPRDLFPGLLLLNLLMVLMAEPFLQGAIPLRHHELPGWRYATSLLSVYLMWGVFAAMEFRLRAALLLPLFWAGGYVGGLLISRDVWEPTWSALWHEAGKFYVAGVVLCASLAILARLTGEDFAGDAVAWIFGAVVLTSLLR